MMVMGSVLKDETSQKPNQSPEIKEQKQGSEKEKN
jgi:hypothetical protein